MVDRRETQNNINIIPAVIDAKNITRVAFLPTFQTTVNFIVWAGNNPIIYEVLRENAKIGLLGTRRSSFVMDLAHIHLASLIDGR